MGKLKSLLLINSQIQVKDREEKAIKSALKTKGKVINSVLKTKEKAIRLVILNKGKATKSVVTSNLTNSRMNHLSNS